MRSLPEVIDQMLCVIPKSEGSLIAGLSSVQSSVPYTPPESMGFAWRRASECLNDRFGHLEDYEVLRPGSWTKELFDIWMDKVLDSPAHP